MSRTVRSSQPPGGQSSISLSWHDHHRSHHEPKLSSRKTQPTPRRCHDTASASCYRETRNGGGGSLSARARNSSSQLDRSYRKDDHDLQRVSSHHSGRQSRHHSAHDDFFQSRSSHHMRRTASAGREDASGSRHSARTHRKSEHAPVSSRSLPQFGAAGSTGDRRYSRQVPAGKGTRSRFSESEWQAAVHNGRHSENQARMSRTLPGEELPSPIQDPWMEAYERNDDTYMPSSRSRSHNPQCTLLYSRAKQNDQLDYPREDYPRQDDYMEHSARHSAQRSSGIFRSQDAKSKKQSSYDKSSLKSHKKPVPGRCPQPWGSMGSSATTSAQGSVIDSSVTDLWDTCSVDSLPLGAEWFNFMHAH